MVGEWVKLLHWQNSTPRPASPSDERLGFGCHWFVHRSSVRALRNRWHVEPLLFTVRGLGGSFPSLSAVSTHTIFGLFTAPRPETPRHGSYRVSFTILCAVRRELLFPLSVGEQTRPLEKNWMDAFCGEEWLLEINLKPPRTYKRAALGLLIFCEEPSNP